MHSSLEISEKEMLNPLAQEEEIEVEEGNIYTCHLCSNIPKLIIANSSISFTCKLNHFVTLNAWNVGEIYNAMTQKYVNEFKCKQENCTNKANFVCDECGYLCNRCKKIDEENPEHHNILEIKETINTCREHNIKFIAYCVEHKKHICNSCFAEHQNCYLLDSENLKIDEQKIKNIKNILSQKSSENSMANLISDIINVYKQFPENYFYRANVVTLLKNYDMIVDHLLGVVKVNAVISFERRSFCNSSCLVILLLLFIINALALCYIFFDYLGKSKKGNK